MVRPAEWVSARIPPGIAAITVLALGLGIRAVGGGPFAKYAGVALYAAWIYVLIVLITPRRSVPVTAALALGVCWIVEFAQLTSLPASLSARSVVLRLVLGTTFNPPDLAWYAVGVALAATGHIGGRRWGHRRGPGLGPN